MVYFCMSCRKLTKPSDILPYHISSTILGEKKKKLTATSEPMFGGFVGPSFLSAYVSGNIFASPTAAQILEAIKLCQPDPGHHPGTLVVCGNYTGDILNAGLAITRAQALGYKVAFVPVGDDVAVGRKKGGKVGRRGLSGHLVGLKIACGVAEREKGTAGYGLDRVREVMEWVVANVGTMGVAFDR